MTVTRRCLSGRALIVLAFTGALTACNSNATAPGGGGATTTVMYQGTAAGTYGTGTFTATIIVPVSIAGNSATAESEGTNVVRGLDRARGSSQETGTLTITLLNGQTITLTGSWTGLSFVMSDAIKGDSCNGTAPPSKIGRYGAPFQATCTFAAAPGTTMALVGALESAADKGELTLLCGLEYWAYASVDSALIDASLVIGFDGFNSFAIRTTIYPNPNYIPLVTLFGGHASNPFVDTVLGTPWSPVPPVIRGSIASLSATGVDSLPGLGRIGAWTATQCQPEHASIAPEAATFTALVDSSPPAQKLLVSPATVGAMSAAVPAGVSWLKDSVSADTLILSVRPQGTDTSLQTTVTLYPQFASAAIAVPVSLTVTGQSNLGALWLGNSDGQLLQYTGLTTSDAAPTISSGSGYASGVGYLAVDLQGDLWLSSAFRRTVADLAPANVATGVVTTVVTLPQPPEGVPPQPVGIAFDASGDLWVADSGNSGWFYGFSPAHLALSTPTPSQTYDIVGVNGRGPVDDIKLAGVAVDKAGNLWLSDESHPYVYEILSSQLGGSDLELEANAFLFVGPGNAGVQAQSIAFDASGDLWVSFLSPTAAGAVYEYAAAALANLTTNPTPSPSAVVSVAGVADSITSIAFDALGDLWLVESARANVSTALAMVPASKIKATGAYQVTPTVTYAASSDAQLPTSLAFAPPPANLPIYAKVAGRSAPRRLIQRAGRLP